MTPLKGPDGVDYAVASGSVVVGGFFAAAPGGGQGLATAQKNQPNVGHVTGGAVVEIEARGGIVCQNQVRFLLRQPDHSTAAQISKVINAKFPLSVVAVDAGTVQVRMPRFFRHKVVRFVSELGALEVKPDVPATVVIDERTGTIVAGENVKISTVAIAHGNLTIATSTQLIPSQPPPFSGGQTTVVPQSGVAAEEQPGAMNVLPKTTTVGDLAKAMQALGASVQDMISIFQAMKKAGALHATLKSR